MVEALELSRVRCILVGFDRVASKVTCLPVKPDRVQKYLSGMHYQYTLLYPVSVSGLRGSTTALIHVQVIKHCKDVGIELVYDVIEMEDDKRTALLQMDTRQM